MVVFKNIYHLILDAEFRPGDTLDSIISELSNRVFVIHPFVSVQKEFGYSDVTCANNCCGRVDEMFRRSSESINILTDVMKFYQDPPLDVLPVVIDYDYITIPTFVLHTASKATTLDFRIQFDGKPEFDSRAYIMPGSLN